MPKAFSCGPTVINDCFRLLINAIIKGIQEASVIRDFQTSYVIIKLFSDIIVLNTFLC